MVSPRADGTLQRDEGDVERARPRKRTWRACDKCSTQRARCDGVFPCRRCTDYGYICAYDRPVKKRGRTRLASRPNNTATTPAAIDVQMVGASQLPSASTNSSLSFLIDPVEELAAGGDQVPAGEVGDAARRDGIHPCIAFDGDPFGQEASQGSPLLRWRRPSPTATARCRYRVLDPLLPYLSDILSVPTACDLFDVYLTDPGSSPFRYAPPYVLTRIFRKKSLLHPTNPRPLSAALLATILWCCAQAAELPSLLAPGARSRTTKALYDLAVALISERHVGQWWRGDAQPLSEPDAPRDSTSTDDSQPTDRNDIREHLGAVDDVLAYLLLCIAVSGGEFKADCQEWWHRAIRTTMTLGLHCEDEACLLGVDCTRPMCACRVPSGEPSLAFLEAKEERRRVFWLLYCLDRHLALSFNRTLQMPDSYVEVRAPLPERVWEDLDEIWDQAYPVDTLGPPTRITGTSFFEYFLPLMVVLGDVIELHHGRQHPRLFSRCADGIRSLIEQSIGTCEASLAELAARGDMFEADSQGRTTDVQLVVCYCTHILHVLHILLYSQWDPIDMLDNEDGWIATQDFSKCASHAIAASEAVSRILEHDPELAFMPYLFGIYLLQGSFIPLLFADRMPQLGMNQSVAQACETIIRAHEVCIVTLTTEFQRSFRRAVRSTLYSVRGISLAELEECKQARRRVLSLYRWTKGARGLGI